VRNHPCVPCVLWTSLRAPSGERGGEHTYAHKVCPSCSLSRARAPRSPALNKGRTAVADQKQLDKIVIVGRSMLARPRRHMRRRGRACPNQRFCRETRDANRKERRGEGAARVGEGVASTMCCLCLPTACYIRQNSAQKGGKRCRRRAALTLEPELPPPPPALTSDHRCLPPPPPPLSSRAQRSPRPSPAPAT
jgi:hypothetical protein